MIKNKTKTKSERFEEIIKKYELLKTFGFKFAYKSEEEYDAAMKKQIELEMMAVEKEYKDAGKKRMVTIIPIELKNGDKFEVYIRGKNVRIKAINIDNTIKEYSENIKKEVLNAAYDCHIDNSYSKDVLSDFYNDAMNGIYSATLEI